MRWQFGGNLQPVRMICEFDWRECPSALINYAWSEIVTDVVECLTNESIMWRVIAMLLVCSLLIHAIYSKARWIDETTITRENLNIVGSKIQDLELKVNILTYKMQYGNWPLPRQIRGTIVEGQLLGNEQPLTLTNSSDRNTWLKRILLSSPAENAACVRYAKIGPRSMRCLTKLINLETKYSRESGGTEKTKKYQEFFKPRVTENPIGNSQSLEIGSKYSTPNEQKNSWSETRVSEVLTSDRKTNYRDNQLNLRKKSTPSIYKIDNYSINRKSYSRLDNRLEFNFDKLIDKSPEERVNLTQETLHRVTQKLQDLHSVLRIYGNPSCSRNTTREEECSNKEMAETIFRDLKNIGNLPPPTESDSDERKTSTTVVKLLESNTEETNETSEFEQCHSDRSSTSIRSHEKISTIVTSRLIQSKDNVCENCDLKNVIIESIKDNCFDSDRTKFLPPIISSEEETQVSVEIENKLIRDKPELSSDTDEKSNDTLFREAITFKETLINDIEFDKERDETRGEDKNQEIDEKLFNEQWPKVKNHLETKLLDIISEEQSASSSTDKQNNESNVDKKRTREKITIENNDHLVGQSSEYFSLSNLEEKMLAQRIVSLTAKDTIEISSSSSSISSDYLTQKEDVEKIETIGQNNDDEILQKNISDLVNQSVQNIREYIQVFSKMQNDAIVETRRAMIDDNSSSNPIKHCSSEDSIMHFVNHVANVDSMIEELPKELPEYGIDSLVDLTAEISEDERTLKRRPGFMSLAEPNLSNDNQSIFESANSEDTEILSLLDEPSCKQLVMDYLPETSDSDLTDDKMNLIEFEDESCGKDRDDKRSAESPLTGRTVIRATSRLLENMESAESWSSAIHNDENLQNRESKVDLEKFETIETEKKASTANLSSDTSGTYMDAGSKDFLNPSDISLDLERKIVNDNVGKSDSSKSARGSSSLSPLRQQRVPWIKPKRGSSLNNATVPRTKKPEIPRQVTRAKSVTSGGYQQRCTSGRDIQSSSILTPGRLAREAKSADLSDRRSRSYVTPRKIEASPRNSMTRQSTNTPRIARPRGDIDKKTIIVNKNKSEDNCVGKNSSKSCIPLLRRRIRAKSPARGPLTISTSSWREDNQVTENSTMEINQGEGNMTKNDDKSSDSIVDNTKSMEIGIQGKNNVNDKLPESRTVIYVNIATEQDSNATRIVDPKKFLEYLKDRELKIQSVFGNEKDTETISNTLTTTDPTNCSSPRILTVVSTAAIDERGLSNAWSLRVEQKEIQVTAKPSVIDTSTSISDLPEIITETPNFEIFQVPKELTKHEYTMLLEALNQHPNLHKLRQMHKLCDKLDTNFRE